MTPEADVTVIGAGASGLCAAIFAGRFGRKVVVAEHMPSPGKKLLLTGNGKCNLSNLDLSTAYYHGAGRDFLSAAFGRFDGLKTREFFLSLGVPFRNKDGYLYPLCEEAHGVLQALLNECSRLGVSLNYNIGIRKISPVSGGFLLDTKEGEVFSRYSGHRRSLPEGDRQRWERASLSDRGAGASGRSDPSCIVAIICRLSVFKGGAGRPYPGHDHASDL